MVIVSALGNHQIVISVDEINMRCFRPPRFRLIPENIFFTDQLQIFDIELLKKYFGVPV